MAINDKNMAGGDFWCNVAAESIYTSADRRAKAADSLKTVITWAFGVFSTGGFAVSLFGSIKEFNGSALICLGVAFFLLTIAYCVANMAQYPVSETYNAQDPVEITIAFSKAVKHQATVFNTAVIISSSGFFFFALGLLLQFTHVKSNPPKIPLPAPFTLNTSIQLKDGKMYIPVTVRAGKNDSVNVAIYNSTPPKVGKVAAVLLFSVILKPDTAGIVYYSYSRQAEDSVKAITVTASIEKKNGDTIAEQKNTANLKIK
ncbi:hypothetical protein [Mucilaginibacter pedocola]|uniref:Uncharacterized protein n=1 Tax=Mucilaginibacter pedocola TaxID=1792845 RepID=A0A1S9PCT3_9SPHI|nr:hypothetical protein [Mucilaginibacter pedocola]OOQ58796.1 hypothetical protein BC343_09105 [Mucilaginibacter pedocola]